MRFRQHQDDARRATRRLLLLFVLTVVLTVLCTNGALALVWRLMSGGLLGYPRWFFETNTMVTLGFILGGSWVETLRLRGGGAHVAQMMGGREVVQPRTRGERRLRNVVDEVAIASGLKSPRVFVLEREDAINAFAAGWEQQDSVVAITRGALERLTRDELQGVVAHEFGHILNGDTRLNMRLIGYVFGLQMIFNFGRSLVDARDAQGRRGLALPMGLALMVAGTIGHLAGRLLQAAVSRQREFLADAHAVQFTRLPEGIGGALRKIAHQLGAGEGSMQHAQTDVVAHLLLSGRSPSAHSWFATHPILAQRLQRIYGRAVTAVPAPVIDIADNLPVPGVAAFAWPAAAAAAGPRAGPGPDAAAAGGGGDGPAAASAAGTQIDIAASTATAQTLAEQTLQRLGAFTPPELLRAAILAFLVPPHGLPERSAWQVAVGGVSGAQAAQDAVWSLPGRRRQPWFERLVQHASDLPAPERRQLRAQALQIVGADGRLVLHELLAALLIHHDLSPRRERLVIEPRHLPLSALAAEVALVTRAIAALLPQDQADGWSQQVLAKLDLPATAPPHAAPDAAAVRSALDRLRRLAMVQSPLLAKQWVACQPVQPMALPMAEVLRSLCLLLDTPMPSQLAGMFDAVDSA